MFGFLIKKSFFDLWDHFLPAILVNLGFIAILALPILLPAAVIAVSPVLGLVVFVLGALCVFVYLGGASTFARRVTDYVEPEWREFFASIKDQWFHSTLFGVLVLAHLGLISIALPVYTGMGSMIGLFALAVLFWISMIWWLTCLYIFPVRSRLSDKPGQVLRKSLLLLLDNTFFSIAVAVGAIRIMVLSIFTAFLIPGISGVMIWLQTAVKLRLYKYDYREETNEKGPIPWDTLLYQDRERVGKRTLRGMIFPWKE